MERILIIGGGFAGLNLAKRLDKTKYKVMGRSTATTSTASRRSSTKWPLRG